MLPKSRTHAFHLWHISHAVGGDVSNTLAPEKSDGSQWLRSSLTDLSPIRVASGLQRERLISSEAAAVVVQFIEADSITMTMERST